MTASQRQLVVIGTLHDAFERHGVAYWLFGGWAVDFHAGRLTRSHADIDIAIWDADRPRLGALLAADGWTHTPEADGDGYTGYARDDVHLEVAFIARDDAGAVYTPVLDGRAAWPHDTFGDDVLHLLGVHARVIRREALIAEKSVVREAMETASKDAADVLVLTRSPTD